MQLAQLRQQYQLMGGVPDRAPKAPSAMPAKENDRVMAAAQRRTKTSAALVPSRNPSYTPHAGHTTSGLRWGTSHPADIMAKAGTSVGSPVDGVVVSFDPKGAQGGGSMLIRARSGREYWLGHIMQGVAPGTQVRRGDPVAKISPDHANPHLHIDWRKV